MARTSVICLLLFFLSSFDLSAQKITSISFSGLTKTKEKLLRSIIKCEEGMELNEKVFFEDEQAIRNLNLFFDVHPELEYNADSTECDIIFELKEAKYLYPIFSIGGFRTQFQLEAGVNQINFRGMAESIGALYKFYDRHSFSAFYNAPRHKNGITGHDFSLTKYSTIEPLYFQDTVSSFNFNNYNGSAGVHFWLTQRLTTGIGGMYMYETYKQRDSGAVDLGQTEFAFHKWQVRAFIHYNGYKTNYEFIDGFRYRLYAETIQTVDYPDISFFKLTNDIYWFKTIGQRGNFGIHNRIGLATNNDSPFSPFVLDGFINVRGVGNRVSRGTAEFITNAEFRYSIWRHKWFILQAVALSDLGTLRQPGATIEDMFNYNELEWFVGGGFRVNSRVFYNTSFRIDYSVSPIDTKKHGLTFGVGQFF